MLRLRQQMHLPKPASKYIQESLHLFPSSAWLTSSEAKGLTRLANDSSLDVGRADQLVRVRRAACGQGALLGLVLALAGENDVLGDNVSGVKNVRLVRAS